MHDSQNSNVKLFRISYQEKLTEFELRMNKYTDVVHHSTCIRFTQKKFNNISNYVINARKRFKYLKNLFESLDYVRRKCYTSSEYKPTTSYVYVN